MTAGGERNNHDRSCLGLYPRSPLGRLSYTVIIPCAFVGCEQADDFFFFCPAGPPGQQRPNLRSIGTTAGSSCSFNVAVAAFDPLRVVLHFHHISGGGEVAESIGVEVQCATGFLLAELGAQAKKAGFQLLGEAVDLLSNPIIYYGSSGSAVLVLHND